MTVTTFDSIIKTIHYLSMIAVENICIKDRCFSPPGILVVSPTFWRDYTCPPLCGGCCRAFSMDFWPWEWPLFLKVYPEHEQKFRQRHVIVCGREQFFYSNRHTALVRFKKGQKCQFLNLGTGRCEIHSYSPFSCRFELNKLQFFPKRNTCILGKKIFRNGWRYRRVGGQVGALCKMIPTSEETIAAVQYRDIPLLRQLAVIADHFGIVHRGWELVRLLEEMRGTDFYHQVVLP